MSVYLDHNATTPLDERVVEAMMPYLTGCFGNPSGVYSLGREARAAVDAAREQVAALVKAHPSQVTFTSGGTEANNLAITGMVRGHRLAQIAISTVEHASVLGPAHALRDSEVKVTDIPVDSQGRVTDQVLARVLREGAPQLVSVMMVNNETGVVNDLAALSALAREYGAMMHTDAVQAAGKMPVDFAASGVHLMTLSAHKIYGPKGAGALIADKALDLRPLFQGGGQEKGRRPGTENVAAIVGFGKAAELAVQELETRRRRVQTLRDLLEARLSAMPEVMVFGRQAQRVSNTVFLGLPGIDGETLLMNLDAEGIAVSSGSACDSGSTEPSHVLVAMGVEERFARGAVRVSLGHENSEADVEQFVSALARQIQLLRSMPSLAWC